MDKEIRKGLVNHEVNSSFTGFIIAEFLLVTAALTFIMVDKFNWNWFASLVISGVFSLALTLSKLYHMLGILFSIGWGYGAYELFYYLTTVTGGGKGLGIAIGVLGFILAFCLTLGARLAGKEYLDDIE